jgi:hypothetical protein
MSIFGMWAAFWGVSTLIMILSPWIREDIERADILPSLLGISTIWIPPLSCLAAFWFPQAEQEKAKSIRPSKDKIYGAFGITTIYLLFVLGLIVYSTFVVQSTTGSADPRDITLLGQINQTIKLALVTSPVALAPINWLTGGARR